MPPFIQQRSDPKTRRLAELSALAQVYSGLTAPAQQQQMQQTQLQHQERQAKQAAMLQLLGLLQTGQHQDAVLKETQANRQGDEAYRKAMLDAQGQAQVDAVSKANAELDLQRQAQENLVNHQAAMELIGSGQLANEGAKIAYDAAHNQAIEKQNVDALAQRAAAEKEQSARVLLTELARNPNMTPRALLDVGSKMNIPGADPALQSLLDATAQTTADQLRPILSSVYQGFEKSPTKAQGALDNAWQDPRMQDILVQEKLGPLLQSLNAGLAPATSAPPAKPATTAGAAIGTMTNDALNNTLRTVMNVPAMVYNTGGNVADLLAAALGSDFRTSRMYGPGDIWEQYRKTGVMPPEILHKP